MKRSGIIITWGILFILSAVSLTGYNLWSDSNAGKASVQALERLLSENEQSIVNSDEQNVIADYILNPKMDMPEKEVNGKLYIGYIEIPALNIMLPVLSQYSDSNLNTAPCRYMGSAYLDNMIIAAHNFQSHFGNLSGLVVGDTVKFTDIDGNCFVYEVIAFESLREDQVEDMKRGEWDMTLFTCTFDGSSRTTVRCVKRS